MISRSRKILQMTLARDNCNGIPERPEKPVITSLFTKEEDSVADYPQEDIISIENAEIIMDLSPISNNPQSIPHENLNIYTTECNSIVGNVITANDDLYDVIFLSEDNVPFSNPKDILKKNIDEFHSIDNFSQGNGNKDRNNESEKPQINILQNIIIQHNEEKLQVDEIFTKNLQNVEDCNTSEDPAYLPVESSDTSEQEEEQNVEAAQIKETKGKKRKRNSGNWKKNIRKQRRSAGEEYLSATNKLIGKNEMKAPCSDDCKKQCKQNLSVECRALIHSQFWNDSIDLNQKRQFIASCIEEVPVERVRVRTGARSGRRKTSLKYFFSVNGKKIKVCRTYFLNTLNISQTSVRNALSKRQLGGMVIPDQRGKHEPSNKIASNIRNNIREHIQKFPCIESHYSRNKSQRKYSGSHLNIPIMYQCFYEDCIENQIPEGDIPKQWLYNEIFNSEFNLSFKEPANDTCDTCDGYVIKLKEAVSEDERLELQTNYDAHLHDADNRYQLKRKDKEIHKTEANTTKELSVDLQKCLPTPQLTNAQSFYSLKLWTFNYTIYDATEKIGYCFAWDETIAGRGGNEMASCILKYINLHVKESVEKIIIWSDNCPSQNRNIQMIMCYLSIIMLRPSIKCIEHKYLLRGHTHMEVDTIHARIERQKKATPQFSLITPWDWQQLFKLSGNNIKVTDMETLDFKNFTLLSEESGSLFHNNKKTSKNQNFLISKVVHMKFLTETPGILYFKTDFNEENFEQVDFNKATKRLTRKEKLNNINSKDVLRNADLMLPKAIRETLKPISKKKYDDLQKLLTWVPKRFHEYFKNLPHGNLEEDD